MFWKKKTMKTNGKGDSPRNCFTQRYRNNYDDIFGIKTCKNDKSRDITACQKSGGPDSEGDRLPPRDQDV